MSFLISQKWFLFKFSNSNKELLLYVILFIFIINYFQQDNNFTIKPKVLIL